MSQNQKKKLLLSVLFGITVVVSILLVIFGVLDSWQEKITDRLFTKQQPQQNIVILAIDNESIQAIGQWPWPRAVYAEALSHLKNAKVIGIDINFSESSNLGTQDDELLSKALQAQSATTPIIVPFEREARGRISNRPRALFQSFVKEGFVNIDVDSDGIVRHLTSQSDNEVSFSKLVVQQVNNQSNVPSSFRIDYKGPEKTYLTFPIVDVIQNKVPERVFKDAIVLIGATAANLHDEVNTPFGIMPGVEVHANAIETMLDGNFIRPLSKPLTVVFLIIVDLLVFTSIVFLRRFSLLLFVLGILLIGTNIVGVIVFSYHIIFPNVYLSLSLLVVTLLTITFQYISESQEKRFIRKSFQHYTAKELVDELVQHPEKLVLGGERRNVSILFSDIRSFTTISESMTPEALTSFMSEYFAVVSDLVIERRGILDKYIGDAIMAFWGAPLENPAHTFDACRVAINMLRNVHEQNKIWTARGLPLIKIGIGINTGDVVVGNMGSKKRFNYSILGDNVNFASRLEGLTKEYDVGCIVSESAAQKIIVANTPDLQVRELDTVRVKGKKEPRKIFELLTEPLTEEKRKQLEFFEQGRTLYQKGKWEAAISVFKNVLNIGNDGPSRMLIERCEYFKKNSPEHWTGVYDFKTK